MQPSTQQAKAIAIYALLFEVAPPSKTGSMSLIAWLDAHGNGRYCHHAHPNKTLLDVEPGHTVIHQRKQFRVLRVKPYRTKECRDEAQYPWVQSGRDYVENG